MTTSLCALYCMSISAPYSLFRSRLQEQTAKSAMKMGAQRCRPTPAIDARFAGMTRRLSRSACGISHPSLRTEHEQKLRSFEAEVTTHARPCSSARHRLRGDDEVVREHDRGRLQHAGPMNAETGRRERVRSLSVYRADA